MITLVNLDILVFYIPWNVQIVAYYDILIILGIIFTMLRVGAKINNYYVYHKDILLGHKRNLWRMRGCYDLFKNKSKFSSNSFKIIRDYIKDKSMNQEEREKYVEDMISTIDIITERLDQNFEHHPVRLLGLK